MSIPCLRLPKLWHTIATPKQPKNWLPIQDFTAQLQATRAQMHFKLSLFSWRYHKALQFCRTILQSHQPLRGMYSISLHVTAHGLVGQLFFRWATSAAAEVWLQTTFRAAPFFPEVNLKTPAVSTRLLLPISLVHPSPPLPHQAEILTHPCGFLGFAVSTSHLDSKRLGLRRRGRFLPQPDQATASARSCDDGQHPVRASRHRYVKCPLALVLFGRKCFLRAAVTTRLCPLLT